MKTFSQFLREGALSKNKHGAIERGWGLVCHKFSEDDIDEDVVKEGDLFIDEKEFCRYLEKGYNELFGDDKVELDSLHSDPEIAAKLKAKMAAAGAEREARLGEITYERLKQLPRWEEFSTDQCFIVHNF